MESYKNILISAIRNSSDKKTREYFELVCKKWVENDWLDDEEAKEVLIEIDKAYS